MKFLDALLGRSRPVRSHLESLMSISTACTHICCEQWAGEQGQCRYLLSRAIIKPVCRSPARTRRSPGCKWQRDGHGYPDQERCILASTWVVLQDPDFEDLVTTIHMVSLTLSEHGYRDQLLAAAFHFADMAGTGMYWIYNYKRGSFYPFAPNGSRTRDNALELRMQAVADRELPLETDQSKWYALWELPV